jgi:taurine dioxygenase
MLDDAVCAGMNAGLEASIETGPLDDLTPFFGTRISGFDVKAIRSSGEVTALQRLLAEKQVVVFKDQDLGPDDVLGFTKLFGTPDPHVLSQFSLPGYRDIYVLSNIVEDGRHVGNRQEGFGWHTDLSYFANPAAYTMLYALEVPAARGETLFASMQCFYREMPEDEKAKLRPLTVKWNYERMYSLRTNVPPLTDEQRARTPEVTQPLVRIHPVSGRESLYTSRDGCAGVHGMPEDEGLTLIRGLVQRIIDSPFTYAHRWEARDLVIWDNRGLIHTATDYDMENDRRLIYRTSVRGERPIGWSEHVRSAVKEPA